MPDLHMSKGSQDVQSTRFTIADRGMQGVLSVTPREINGPPGTR